VPHLATPVDPVDVAGDQAYVPNLTDQLAFDADYGRRSYADVLDDIEQGRLTIAEGPLKPVLREKDGTLAKGSGQPSLPVVAQPDLTALAKQRRTAEGRTWLEGRLLGTSEITRGAKHANDRDMIYDHMLDAVENGERGWMRIAEFMMTQYVGKPKETSGNTAGGVLEVIFNALQQTTTVRAAELTSGD
jgi:hypothetical protein